MQLYMVNMYKILICQLVEKNLSSHKTTSFFKNNNWENADPI